MDLDLTIDALGTTVSGQLVYVSPAMDDSAKTYTARIALDESPQTIQAGLFAQGEVDIQQRADTLVVPKEAVLTKNGHTTVFVIKEDQTVEEREVTIGLLNDTEEEILYGIADGDKVVLSNQDRLKDGMKVDLAEAAS
jgi:RND family efflux transporter MFP subunit